MAQCAGRNKDNTPCKKPPIKGKKYCHIHQRQKYKKFFTVFAAIMVIVTYINIYTSLFADITQILMFFGIENSPPATQIISKTPFFITTGDPQKSRIVIADFENRSKNNQKSIDPAGYIFTELDNRLKREKLPIEIIRLGYAVNENSALFVGKELGCTVLIWGWYDDLTITPRIERIRVISCKPTDDPKALSIASEVELKINVTSSLPEQVSHLIFVILAADRMAYQEYDLALKYLNEALSNFRNCEGHIEAHNAYSLRGDIYRLKGEYDAAIRDYNCALQTNPDDADTYYNRALVYGDKGEEKAAKDDFAKAIHLYTETLNDKPLDHKTRRKRAFTFLNLNDYDNAIKDLQYIVNASSNSSIAHRDLGYALRLKGDLDTAIYELDKAVDLDPEDFDAYTNLGIAYRDRGKEGDIEEALFAFNKALQANPDYVPALKYRGFIWISQNELEKAIEDFKRVVSLDYQNPIAHRDLGYAYRLNTEYNLAIEHLTIALQQNAHDADAYLNRALAYQAIQKNEEAMNDYCLVLQNSNTGSWINDIAKQELIKMNAEKCNK